MKRPNFQRDTFLKELFELDDDSVEFRNTWRGRANLFVWAALSGITLLLFIFLAKDNLGRISILALSAVKYIPLIIVVYAVAKAKAATYLADVFEIEDETIASDFIEEIAFGYGSDRITINQGKISEKDEESPLILIGGPGYIQVNLDSVALLEQVDGTPEIISPRGEPWKMGRFERIREIGKFDEPGKREYAIINLRDQFVRGLTVRARTKDGIPIEAQDIKVLFSILRKPKEEAPENDPYHFQESAVYSLVYDQAIITPPPSKASGVSFPWDTTVIPLINTELENLITSRNLSELLANISHKEIDAINENEATNIQMRVEMTGEHTSTEKSGGIKTPNFESRSKITAQFFSKDFQKKAAAIGISIHWIDIGTWQLPSDLILDELKSAWSKLRVNADRRNSLKHAAKKHEMNELTDLVNNVIVSNFSKSGSGSNRKLSQKEFLQFLDLIEEKSEIANSPALQQRFSQDVASKKDANTVALEILKGFRHELIAARELIQKENRSSIDKQAEIARISKALRDIDYHVFHYLKGNS